MSDSHIYHTNVQWSTQRKGKLSNKGMPTIEIATPPEFPGGHPDIWSPEHLFVASAEICLMTTFLSIAEKSKLLVVGDTDINIDEKYLNRRDEIGLIGRGFVEIANNMKSQANIADEIASGNLSLDIKPKSNKDVLSKSMK